MGSILALFCHTRHNLFGAILLDAYMGAACVLGPCSPTRACASARRTADPFIAISNFDLGPEDVDVSEHIYFTASPTGCSKQGRARPAHSATHFSPQSSGHEDRCRGRWAAQSWVGAFPRR